MKLLPDTRVVERRRQIGIASLFLLLLFVIALTYAIQSNKSDELPCKNIDLKVNDFKDDSSDEAPLPDVNSKTVHYFWCDEKMFEFHNYLSVLSVMKIVKPMKIVFHYTTYPRLDPLEYNSWLRDLRASVPYIVLHDLGRNHSCSQGRSEKLEAVTKHLSQYGGLYVGENTIFSRYPNHARQKSIFYSFPKPNKNEIYERTPHLEQDLDGFIGLAPGSRWNPTDVHGTSSDVGMTACTMYDFETNVARCIALAVNLPVKPKDIWYIDLNFGKLSRLLFYNQTDVMTLKHNSRTLAPRISHYIWFGARTMTYAHYLSVLSSLYVANLTHVYFHGNVEPEGKLWEKLKMEENATHVYMELPEYVYGNVVKNRAHANDVVKMYILDKYGGVNQDPDVFWTKQIPDSHLAYDAVMGFEWVKAEVWPETFNIGVFIAKKHSKFVQEVMLTMKDYRDQHWIYNSGCLPYRVYERFPDVLFADRQLQVLCYKHKCHPPWFKDYNEYYMNDEARYFPIEWKVEPMSVHLTFPKPYPEFESQEALMKSTGMYAEIGRNILTKAGKI